MTIFVTVCFIIVLCVMCYLIDLNSKKIRTLQRKQDTLKVAFNNSLKIFHDMYGNNIQTLRNDVDECKDKMVNLIMEFDANRDIQYEMFGTISDTLSVVGEALEQLSTKPDEKAEEPKKKGVKKK